MRLAERPGVAVAYSWLHLVAAVLHAGDVIPRRPSLCAAARKCRAPSPCPCAWFVSLQKILEPFSSELPFSSALAGRFVDQDEILRRRLGHGCKPASASGKPGPNTATARLAHDIAETPTLLLRASIANLRPAWQVITGQFGPPLDARSTAWKLRPKNEKRLARRLRPERGAPTKDTERGGNGRARRSPHSLRARP